MMLCKMKLSYTVQFSIILVLSYYDLLVEAGVVAGPDWFLGQSCSDGG